MARPLAALGVLAVLTATASASQPTLAWATQTGAMRVAPLLYALVGADCARARARIPGGTGHDDVVAIALAPDGSSYAAGYLQSDTPGDVSFGSTSASAQTVAGFAGQDGFLSKERACTPAVAAPRARIRCPRAAAAATCLVWRAPRESPSGG